MSTHNHLLEIISPAGQVDFYPLEPGQAVHIGQHSDNQLVIEHPDIASVQVVLYQNNKIGSFLLTSQAGETLVNGQCLLPDMSVELTENSIIQFAGYTILLLPSKPLAAAKKSPTPEAYRYWPDPKTIPQPWVIAPAATKKSNSAALPQSSRPRLSVLGSTAGAWLNFLLVLSLLLIIVLLVRSTGFQAESPPTIFNVSEPVDQASAQHAIGAPDFGESGLPLTLRSVNGADYASMTYEEMFREIAIQYKLDWRLLAGLAYQESRLNPWAIGRDNDMGLMQILPTTWNEWAPQVGVTDPFDPYSNVLVAAAYLAYLREYCQTRGYPETQWMLIGYNWGPANLRQLFERNGRWAQVPEKQRRYAVNILQAASPGLIGLDDPLQKMIDISLKSDILN